MLMIIEDYKNIAHYAARLKGIRARSGKGPENIYYMGADSSGGEDNQK
ncbi:MAG: hypothetical protein LBS20_19165 [Prevotella sp.]|nr:hypothetical protein [Prevotella sp.]